MTALIPEPEPYTAAFFSGIRPTARRSAEVVMPLVLDLVRPRSVVDVGCGTATWLAVCRELGVGDVLGVDGPHVDRGMLDIDPADFVTADLRRPLRLDRSFDLVVSLEVAEHLPEVCANDFVASLVSLGPVILFSAAVPHQGGTGHENEQWPEYWAELFRGHGYLPLDCIRWRVWADPGVTWWYAQNTILYVSEERLRSDADLARELARSTPGPLRLVHPSKYLHLADVHLTAQDVARVVPPGGVLVLVDENQYGDLVTTGRRYIPFLERDGLYDGPPADDETAIRELERLRSDGATFLAVTAACSWWLEYYEGFRRHLEENFPVMLSTTRIRLYDLNP